MRGGSGSWPGSDVAVVAAAVDERRAQSERVLEPTPVSRLRVRMKSSDEGGITEVR